jgi:hypothetical protein
MNVELVIEEKFLKILYEEKIIEKEYPIPLNQALN